jgi:hypothetical protein
MTHVKNQTPLAMTTAVVALVALSGCANSAAPANQAAGDATNLICVREYPTGSSIPTTRCRTPEQIARERDEAQRSVDQVGRSNARTGKNE